MEDITFPKLKDMDDYKKVCRFAKDNVYIFQRKFDGVCCMVDIFPNGEVILWGRNFLKDGSRSTLTNNFPEIVEYFKTCEPVRMRILGELVCFNGQEIEKFSNIQPRCTRKYGIEELAEESPATFLAFDIQIYRGIDSTLNCYDARRKILQIIATDFPTDARFKVIPSYLFTEEKEALLLELKEKKFEGVVIKARAKRDQYWKYKPTITEDVIWFGEYNEGTGKNEGQVGSMVCYQYINGELVEIANVGGLTVSARGHFTYMAKGGKVSRDNPIVLEVEAMSRGERTKKGKIGKLRHPRYSRIRLDKSPEQCTREA